MSVSAPESYGLENLDEAREVLESGKFLNHSDAPFILKCLGLTIEDKISRNYESFKEFTGYEGEEAFQQYFMSLGLIAEDEPDYRKDGFFDFLYESISKRENVPSKMNLRSAYYNLEK